MAYYNKIGLLILNKNKTKFLVCEKDPKNETSQYIMPGGHFKDFMSSNEKTLEECLRNEIKEELNCDVDLSSIKYLGKYEDIAAGTKDIKLSMKLYRGKIIGKPKPSTEIKFIHWIGKEDMKNPKVSSIIKNKIIPDLTKKNILK